MDSRTGLPMVVVSGNPMKSTKCVNQSETCVNPTCPTISRAMHTPHPGGCICQQQLPRGATRTRVAPPLAGRRVNASRTGTGIPHSVADNIRLPVKSLTGMLDPAASTCPQASPHEGKRSRASMLVSNLHFRFVAWEWETGNALRVVRTATS